MHNISNTLCVCIYYSRYLWPDLWLDSRNKDVYIFPSLPPSLSLLVILVLIAYSAWVACLQLAHYWVSLKARATVHCGLACHGGSAERAYLPFTRMHWEHWRDGIKTWWVKNVSLTPGQKADEIFMLGWISDAFGRQQPLRTYLFVADVVVNSCCCILKYSKCRVFQQCFYYFFSWCEETC